MLKQAFSRQLAEVLTSETGILFREILTTVNRNRICLTFKIIVLSREAISGQQLPQAGRSIALDGTTNH